MPEKNLFQSDPRDYALELVDEGHSAAHLLLCCLKYLSHDDCRGMLETNEMAPEEEEDEEEEFQAAAEYNAGVFDVNAMQTDYDNNNFDPTSDDPEDYRHETIVRNSLVNGQFTQARQQCDSYGLEFAIEFAKFKVEESKTDA